MAEYFRDDEQRNVLLLIDNIFRFIQAGMEVSGLLGQMPSRLGYQPTLATELSKLEERIANTEAGAITSIQAVYVPANDLTDPAAALPALVGTEVACTFTTAPELIWPSPAAISIACPSKKCPQPQPC
ncbi:hypothetical protein QMK33_15295 [Hymenobacter sp. H14-R3]|nr:hypothetical protein [Hymenobacter sp. H14-R3]MDJ0366523.1 hypothetical protein [Hymenobacter sp. H14-R3]